MLNTFFYKIANFFYKIANAEKHKQLQELEFLQHDNDNRIYWILGTEFGFGFDRQQKVVWVEKVYGDPKYPILFSVDPSDVLEQLDVDLANQILFNLELLR